VEWLELGGRSRGLNMKAPVLLLANIWIFLSIVVCSVLTDANGRLLRLNEFASRVIIIILFTVGIVLSICLIKRSRAWGRLLALFILVVYFALLLPAFL
jgi:hypothetical protein